MEAASLLSSHSLLLFIKTTSLWPPAFLFIVSFTSRYVYSFDQVLKGIRIRHMCPNSSINFPYGLFWVVYLLAYQKRVSDQEYGYSKSCELPLSAMRDLSHQNYTHQFSRLLVQNPSSISKCPLLCSTSTKDLSVCDLSPKSSRGSEHVLFQAVYFSSIPEDGVELGI